MATGWNILGFLRRVLWHKSIIGVLAVVVVWNVLFTSDVVKAQFPFLTDCQLWFHQLLYWASPHPQYVNVVRVVAIDDQTHWTRLGGVNPTNRTFLAQLINHATAASKRPSVIALDVTLKTPGVMGPAKDSAIIDSSERFDDDEELLCAIHTATEGGIPVILAEGLMWDQQANEKRGEWRRERHIFEDFALRLKDSQGRCAYQACVAFGEIHTPKDSRQIPLRVFALEWQGSTETAFDSLALAVATAYEEKTGREPKSFEKPIIKAAMSGPDPDFVFGGFLKDGAFPRIDAEALERNDPDAMRLCDGCILLIGGDWHVLPSGQGKLADGYKTSAGTMSGVFLHANYIEDLLDNRFQRPVSFWAALGFDMAFAVLLYTVHHKVKGKKGKWAVLGIFLVLLLVTYFLFVNLNYYMDFVLPLSLCFVHLGYDHVRDYIRLRRQFGHSVTAE